MFTSEPQPLINSSPHIGMVFPEEACRPVGVASTGKGIIVPPVEVDWGGFRHVNHTRVHGVENIHQFCLNFCIVHWFNSLGPVTLWVTMVRIAQKLRRGNIQWQWQWVYWTQGKSSHDLDSAKQDTSHESGLHRQQSALDLNNAIWNNEWVISPLH